MESAERPKGKIPQPIPKGLNQATAIVADATNDRRSFARTWEFAEGGLRGQDFSR